MFTFFAQVAVAGVIAYFSSPLAWWAPLLAFPLLLRLQLTLAGFYNPVYADEYNYYRNPLFEFLVFLETLGFTIFCAFLCYYGFGAWWGILIGIFIGISAGGLTCPRGWAR